MLRKKISLILLLSMLSSCIFIAHAQITMKGRVVEASNNEPIPNAHISINDEVAVSNSEGYFSHNTSPGDKHIEISFVGMETIDTTIRLKNTSKSFVFKMKEASNVLQTMVVSDSRYSHIYEESTVSMDVIAPKVLETKSPENILRSIDQLPSVHTIGDQINIRGGSGWTYGAGSRVLLLQDGVPMMEGANSEIQWYTIEPLAVRQMEVIKGPSSVMYGASALNGTINAFTRRPTKKGLTKATFQTAMFDDYKRDSWNWNKSTIPLMSHMGTIYHGQKVGNVELSGSGHFFRETSYIKNNVDNERQRFFFKVAHDLEDIGLRYGLSATYINNLRGESFLYHNDSIATTSFDDVTYEFHTNELAVRPFIEYQKPGSNWKHQLNGQFFRVNYIDTVSNFSDTYYGNYHSQWRKDKIALTFGLAGSYIRGVSEAYTVDAQAANAAGFLQAEYGIGNLNIVGGARMEFNTGVDTNYLEPVFRLGANYAINEDLFIKANWGEAIRFPSLFEYFFSRNAGEVSFYSNPDLKPERGWSTELGVVKNFRGDNWNLQAEVDAFLMRFNNMTELSFGLWGDSSNSKLNALGAGFKEINVGETQIAGIEANLKGYGKISKEVEIDFNIGYTYMNPISLDTSFVYASFTDNKQILYDLMNQEPNALFDVIIEGLLRQIGSEVNYNVTSTDPSILKYRFRHLFKADLGVKYRKIHPMVNVRYNSFMSNIDKLFVSYLFNENSDDEFKNVQDVLNGLNANVDLNTINLLIEEAREREKNGTWQVDFRLGYELSDEVEMIFGVENVFNTEYSIRPGRVAPPRRYVLQANIKL
ncbi:MAG: TonB-dependent receptor [Flavobacteriales bacterium]|jgi:iron complex outermembrane receptor protein|nr:TonB-dependent receptor [Flavobacteriales bacterium]